MCGGSPVISPSAVPRLYLREDRLDLEPCPPYPRPLEGQAGAQGPARRRRCAPGARAWRRCGGRLQPWRAPARLCGFCPGPCCPSCSRPPAPCRCSSMASFRRGTTDVVKALALGAAVRLTVGRRLFNYAAAVGGEQGVAHAVALLREEMDRNMALMGCCTSSARSTAASVRRAICAGPSLWSDDAVRSGWRGRWRHRPSGWCHCRRPSREWRAAPHPSDCRSRHRAGNAGRTGMKRADPDRRLRRCCCHPPGRKCRPGSARPPG